MTWWSGREAVRLRRQVGLLRRLPLFVMDWSVVACASMQARQESWPPPGMRVVLPLYLSGARVLK